MDAPKPPQESARLAALHEYRLLDTSPEATFDDITQLVARLCDMPIALVSLVDTDRQWFKSRVGLESTQTARETAFCAHTILENIPLVVTDATLDARFADNPLVTGDPGIRFYAGAPLVTPSGFALGTLCVIDVKPRELSAVQLDALQGLAQAVTALMELRRVSHDLAQSLAKVKVLEDLLPICAWCRQVRDTAGRWHSTEDYFKSQLNVAVTHGMCPSCYAEHRPKSQGT